MITVGKLNYLVEGLVGKELAPKWWESPNKAFESHTPLEMLAIDGERVKEYLIWHAYCAGG
jgi:hypothetical protein